MTKLTNIRERRFGPGYASRCYTYFTQDVYVPLSQLATVQGCRTEATRAAADGLWWLAGQIYGELIDGDLPLEPSEPTAN